MRKEGPDHDGYERFACPAQGDHPHLCCPLRPAGQRPRARCRCCPHRQVPPKVCTQSAVTIAPDIGARHRQDLAFGSEDWARTYAAYRNTIEGWNGYVKDTAHEALAAPGRRRVRGIAAQSIFVALLLMAANFRKIAAFRQLVADGTAAEGCRAGPAPAGKPGRLPARRPNSRSSIVLGGEPVARRGTAQLRRLPGTVRRAKARDGHTSSRYWSVAPHGERVLSP